MSDPYHARYGQHLSQEEANVLLQPSAHTFNSVVDWLADNEITSDQLSYRSDRPWIGVSLPIAKIESLIDAEYYAFQRGDGETVYRSLSYSLPAALHDEIDVIQPTNSFLIKAGLPERGSSSNIRNTLARRDTTATTPPFCDPSYVTPPCLRALYGTTDYQPDASLKNSIGFASFDGQFTDQKMVTDFLARWRPDARGATLQVNAVAGAPNDAQPSSDSNPLPVGRESEANHDAEILTSLGYPLQVTEYSYGGQGPMVQSTNFNTSSPDGYIEPWADWLAYMYSLTTLPTVLSISYGEQEQNLPVEYATRVCRELGALGARGVSILVSTGDHGVGAAGRCKAGMSTTQGAFQPNFPASCPYVTAVGGTEGFGQELAAVREGSFAGGGGFSNVFPMPAYQSNAVKKYLQVFSSTFPEYTSNGNAFYNANGRGLPDISAHALRLAYTGPAADGSEANSTISGTSASAPIAAAIIGLLNDVRLKNNKPVLGFLNPWLYGPAANAFTDVTQGINFGCPELGMNGNTPVGFNAAPGWDAATGLGVPDFKKLSAAVMSDVAPLPTSLFLVPSSMPVAGSSSSSSGAVVAASASTLASAGGNGIINSNSASGSGNSATASGVSASSASVTTLRAFTSADNRVVTAGGALGAFASDVAKKEAGVSGKTGCQAKKRKRSPHAAAEL